MNDEIESVDQPNSVLPLETYIQNAWERIDSIHTDVNFLATVEPLSDADLDHMNQIRKELPEAIEGARAGLKQAKAEFKDVVDNLEDFFKEARSFLDEIS
jgi:hypothetical protein